VSVTTKRTGKRAEYAAKPERGFSKLIHTEESVGLGEISSGKRPSRKREGWSGGGGNRIRAREASVEGTEVGGTSSNGVEGKGK